MKQQLSIEAIRQLEQECRKERSEAIFDTFAGLPRSIWAALSAVGSGAYGRKRSSKPSLTVSAG